MGKLIVIEGTDGSGKSTQIARLTQRLAGEGTDFQKLTFPQYDQPSSALIKMYLNGEFGQKPGDVNAYAASTFYAVDRYASYVKDWKQYYLNGGLLLTDRYTTSNAVHQGSKVDPAGRFDFFRWLYDLEYSKMGLPQPDMVIYLDMPLELTERLMRQREHDTHTAADIHERDAQYLQQCRECARQAASFYHWNVISCARRAELRSVEDIHEELYQLVKTCLQK